MGKIKGIIFDMDNTILHSRIDFTSMKQETYALLSSLEILPSNLDLADYTTSTIIEEAVRSGSMTDGLIQRMWDIPKKYEMIGMQDAELEPGVTELLHKLHGNYCLTVVTNNAVEAAEKALLDNHILEYFDCVAGREMMGSLKPSPDGFHYVLDKYAHIPREAWISIGDSWIDGKAAAEAGIPFIGYQADVEHMELRGVHPLAVINDIRELKLYLQDRH